MRRVATFLLILSLTVPMLGLADWPYDPDDYPLPDPPEKQEQLRPEGSQIPPTYESLQQAIDTAREYRPECPW